ncbi:MAG: DNA polymerase IV [Candidatus Omnitrophica bacterium]|nr:DNA polymerase IV [Candidatus Omnitrophota bacterium]
MNWSHKFIHIDMDAFFAAVEQRDRPELKGKPVIVGGNPNSRSVVSTCSYEARKFGIHSGMPTAQAKRLCPDGVFLTPDFEKYSTASKSIMSIFHTYTPLVEQVSLDEAYLDVTENKLKLEDPVKLAALIKQHIFAVTKLTASAGVAPNMFLAKIASDMQKPDGLTVVAPDRVLEFLKDLPVRKIPGVGPRTEEILHGMTLNTCGDVWGVKPQDLCAKLGKWGLELFHKARGEESREVNPHWERTQLSAEETFSKDVADIPWLKRKLAQLAEHVFYDLKQEGRTGRTVVLKVKYHDFEQITRSKTLAAPPQDWHILHEIACDLLKRKTLAGRKPIRLLGLGISGLRGKDELSVTTQGELF